MSRSLYVKDHFNLEDFSNGAGYMNLVSLFARVMRVGGIVLFF